MTWCMVVMGGEAEARDVNFHFFLKSDSLASASPPTTPKALVIPRRLISDNVDYPIVEDNQRGKRVIKDHSGEGSHPW